MSREDSEMTFSVIVPCYNEEAVIAETHKRLTEVMGRLGETYEIIYVNDGSSDGTAAILRELSERDPHAKALMFARNCGHQIADTAGLDHVSGRAVIIIDADLQDPPEVIPEMAEKWRSGAQVVYGQRRQRQGESFFKKTTASLFYKTLARLTNGMVPRDTGDFRLVDRQVVDAIRSMPEHDRFLRGMFAWVGFRQEAVLYDRDKRFAGETHYPLKKMLQLAGNGIFSFSVKPLRFATLLGMLWTGLGILGLLILLVLTLCGKSFAAWYLASFGALLAGNILLCLGIAGEYLARIYNEARNRPLYLIAETAGFQCENKDD